jgi:hypothetical protein
VDVGRETDAVGHAHELLLGPLVDALGRQAQEVEGKAQGRIFSGHGHLIDRF